MRKGAFRKLEKYMMEQIDQDNLIEVEKVQRYISMVKMKLDLEKCIEEEGVIVETINASQSFLKENPAINSWNKLESTMIKLLDSINFEANQATVKVNGLVKEAKKEIPNNVIEIKQGLL
ncbi:P27 family phage terminase small subunit [Dolosigranulum pigrum]|nr:MAG TPA_asm: terminase small subunit [Caudoviricetes sp.]